MSTQLKELLKYLHEGQRSSHISIGEMRSRCGYAFNVSKGLLKTKAQTEVLVEAPAICSRSKAIVAKELHQRCM